MLTEVLSQQTKWLNTTLLSVLLTLGIEMEVTVSLEDLKEDQLIQLQVVAELFRMRLTLVNSYQRDKRLSVMTPLRIGSLYLLMVMSASQSVEKMSLS